MHRPTGEPIEARLAGWLSFRDPTRFVAVVFGAGNYRMLTEDRRPPPLLSAGDQLEFGPLIASVRSLDHPRLVRIRFAGSPASILRDLVRHGRPIQYAHIPEPLMLWDVWTKVAADPIAFEAPSAGFALDWRTFKGWRERGVDFATLSHAAGLSSTGDAALDQRLPFDEYYRIPEACAWAIEAAKSRSGRVIAIGTSVVRALESAASADGTVRAGEGRASGRIARGAPLRVVDAVLTGVHQPGESHYELLRAFADDKVLDRVRAAVNEQDYRAHEFGDSLLIEGQAA
jgi:S-adenosylmethionine:tRNA ribosyltransferase-isomerase